jgi:hypothetical protein
MFPLFSIFLKYFDKIYDIGVWIYSYRYFPLYDLGKIWYKNSGHTPVVDS